MSSCLVKQLTWRHVFNWPVEEEQMEYSQTLDQTWSRSKVKSNTVGNVGLSIISNASALITYPQHKSLLVLVELGDVN